MPPSAKNETDKQKIIVTLALIQNALEENTSRLADHHKALFGNGNPENSIVWAIKELTTSIKDLKTEMNRAFIDQKTEMEAVIRDNDETRKTITTLQSELARFKNNDENLSWKQWFKKISMKWLPIILIIILAIIAFRESITAIIVGLVKLFG